MAYQSVTGSGGESAGTGLQKFDGSIPITLSTDVESCLKFPADVLYRGISYCCIRKVRTVGEKENGEIIRE